MGLTLCVIMPFTAPSNEVGYVKQYFSDLNLFLMALYISIKLFTLKACWSTYPHYTVINYKLANTSM